MLYRTNYAPGCGPPATTGPDPSAATRASPDAPLGWARLHRLDEAWRDAAATAGWLRLLDVSRLSSQRVDRHPGSGPTVRDGPTRDCLHFLLPGPPDAWNALLQAAI